MADANPILLRCYRGDRLESVHRGAWVVWQDDRIVDSGGDQESWVYPRSSLKPLQLLPTFGAGQDRAFDDATRAVMVASHSSDEEHLERVRFILQAAAANEADLACGPHVPMDASAAARLFARGDEPSAIHNNCSGKHAGFLLAARRLGAPLEGYLDIEHPVQREISALISKLSGIPSADLLVGIDGCGAPNWPLPLSVLAAMFRDLANPERLPANLREGAQRMFAAVNAEPHFMAGKGRFDSALLRAARGALIGKCGAEGVFAVGVRGAPGRPASGVAMKIDDGNKRAYEAALPDLLVRLGILERTAEPLASFFAGTVHNTQGRVVGRVESRWR